MFYQYCKLLCPKKYKMSKDSNNSKGKLEQKLGEALENMKSIQVKDEFMTK